MRRDQVLDALLILLEQAVAHTNKLEGQVRDLELALQLDKVAGMQSAFGLTETLAKILVVLADGKTRTKEQLHAALYFQVPDRSRPEIKVLDTLACKLRKHLLPRGVEVKTIWSSGYRITAGLDIVQAAIEHGHADDRRAAAERKRERERERQRCIRAERGCRDRKSYEEQSLSRQRPWEAEGISRRTWYYRASGKPAKASRVVQSKAERDAKQLAEACHYSNLQPLWAIDNLRKGKRRCTGILPTNDNAVVQVENHAPQGGCLMSGLGYTLDELPGVAMRIR